MLVSESDLKILREHIAQLLKASETLETWLTSSYGKFIQFINRGTLGELRKYWTEYQNINAAGKAAAEIKAGLSQRSKEAKNSNVVTGLRSAGPLWADGLQLVGHVYRKYWETGVAGGCSEDSKSLGKEGRVVANPMFAVSSAPSGKFAVHYGTEPLLGFHLAETFRSLTSNQSQTLAAQSQRLIRAAKNQFREWCRAFAAAVEKRCVRIQLFFGEAVTFCHELQLEIALGKQASHARAYTRPWCLHPLRLDGFVGSQDARRSFLDYFDVIDTSNLGDHVGLLNMITATAPLLRPLPSSALCTESLLTVSDNPTTALSAALGCDVATFSLVTSLAPSGLSSGSSMEAVSNEAALQNMTSNSVSDTRQRQYRLRVHWKVPGASTQVRADPDELAAYFLGVYKKMFAQEDMSILFSRMQRMQSKHYSTDMQRYTRAAIVGLLRLVKTKVLTDWDRVMDKFVELVETDQSLLVGSNSLQELNMHLALLGVWTVPVLAEGPRKVQNQFNLPLRPRTSDRGVLGEVKPPPFVYIIMSIPRKQLKVFTDAKAETMGTPGMHVSVKQQFGMNQYENCFYSFHCYFGRFRYDEKSDDGLTCEEDQRGWLGSSDLVIICGVPTFGILTGPRDGLTVSLALNTSPENIMLFGQKLGPLLIVFETSLEDERRVAVCRDPPYIDTESSNNAQRQWLNALSRDSDAEAASTTFDRAHRVDKLQIRKTFPQGSEESKALASGVPVIAEPLDLFTVNLKIGNTSARHICFPLPAQTFNTKTRVARKSSWVEVEAALHIAPQKDPFDTWTYVYSSSDHSLALGYIPRVNLDMQPVITRLTQQDSTWLKMLMAGTLSSAEKQNQHRGETSTANPKSDLKQSLNIIFQGFAGFHPQAKGEVRTFQLTLKSNKSSHTIILVHSMRHDLDLGSIVLDAYVMTLTKARLQSLSSASQRLLSAKSMPSLGVYVSDEESVLWKRLLPALAERCRTWQHNTNCEYRTEGKIP
ncbi:MAG: hypothetical protein Q9225_003904, partial [Loekoesia sp. 1 TL-2023]